MAGLSKVIEDFLKLCEVKEKEKVALYTGHVFDGPLLDEYMTALNNLRTDFLRVIEPVAADSKAVASEPFVHDLFAGADMVIQVRSSGYWDEPIPRISFLHTPEFKKTREMNPGMRWLSVTLPNPEINYRRLFPSKEMIERSLAGKEVMDAAKEIRITSKEGTDFTCRKDGRPGNYQIGLVNKDHTWDNYGCGNVHTKPLEDSAEGTIVVSQGDHWHYPNSPRRLSLIQEPITLRFEKGKLASIEGGMEAKLIRKAMTRYGTDSIYTIAHIGWGTHEGTVWLDNRLFCVADWEGAYGSMMIHFGGYEGAGGPHVSGPTLVDHDFFLDGNPIIRDNQIVHPDCM